MNTNDLERVSFWYGMSFVGSHYYMKIDEGNDLQLGMHEGKARELAILPPVCCQISSPVVS